MSIFDEKRKNYLRFSFLLPIIAKKGKMRLNISSMDLLKGLLDVTVTNECTAGWEESYALNKHSLCRATGMSVRELNQFLDANQIEYSGTWVEYNALTKLEEWYLKKMRRFFRNGITSVVEPGSEEWKLFLQFISTYHKLGRSDVRSWDDIDETRLLRVFVEKCLASDIPYILEYREEGHLLDKIHHSFLFHLRCNKTPKYISVKPHSFNCFILCNQYQIYPTEEGSTAEINQTMAIMPKTQWLNPPRSTTLYGLAS